jgi:uncharacterized membrane protein YfcA
LTFGLFGLFGLFVAGVVAGFLNTLAGGGSLLTLPALMLLGLPAEIANGTNRLAIVAQSSAGVVGFHRAGKLPTEAIGPMLLPTSVGTVLGAVVASRMPSAVLEWVLLGTLAAMAVVLTVAPKAAAPAPGAEAPHRLADRPAGWLGLFVAGLYGGFVQAGVGFVLLWVLGGLLRYDLVRGNALKAVCTSVFGLLSLAVFVAAGQVAWLPAVVLAAGTTTGAMLSVRFALSAPGAIRWIVLATVLAAVVAAAVR